MELFDLLGLTDGDFGSLFSSLTLSRFAALAVLDVLLAESSLLVSSWLLLSMLFVDEDF